MKKFLLVLLCATFLTSCATMPKPFDAARRCAMIAPVDEDGDHIIDVKLHENGTEIRLIIVYMPSQRIGIARCIQSKGCESVVFEETTKEIQTGILTPFGMIDAGLSPEETRQKALSIWSDFTKKNICK